MVKIEYLYDVFLYKNVCLNYFLYIFKDVLIFLINDWVGEIILDNFFVLYRIVH